MKNLPSGGKAIKKSRLLAIGVLATVCSLVIACKTTGTPPQSEQPQGSAPSSPAGSPPQGSVSAQAATENQGQAPAGSAAGRGGARSGVVVRTIPNPVKEFVSGTAKKVEKLYRTVAGQKSAAAREIEYAIAAVIVIGVVAFAASRVRRHRKLTPTSAEARR